MATYLVLGASGIIIIIAIIVTITTIRLALSDAVHGDLSGCLSPAFKFRMGYVDATVNNKYHYTMPTIWLPPVFAIVRRDVFIDSVKAPRQTSTSTSLFDLTQT